MALLAIRVMGANKDPDEVLLEINDGVAEQIHHAIAVSKTTTFISEVTQPIAQALMNAEAVIIKKPPQEPSPQKAAGEAILNVAGAQDGDGKPQAENKTEPAKAADDPPPPAPEAQGLKPE